MKNSIFLGKIKGIRIEINYSWLIIFLLVTLSFANVYFPENFPQLSRGIYWLLGASIAILLFGSVFLHELSHSLVSIKFGLPVKKITLFIFGGIAHIEREPDSPYKELFIAAAGPIMSISLFLFFTITSFVLSFFDVAKIITLPLLYVGNVNLILALFNLVPAFPLDGGRILRALLWKWKGSLYYATRIASNLGSAFSYVLIIYGLILIFGGNLINGLWFIFIGGFINQAAQASYEHTHISSLFKNLPVKNLMTPSVISLHDKMSIQQVVEDYFYAYRHNCFPVMDGETVLGIVTLNEIKKIPREDWPNKEIQEICRTINSNLTASYNDSSLTVFQKIMSNGVGRLLVFNNQKLVGIISKTDILNYINIHNQLR